MFDQTDLLMTYIKEYEENLLKKKGICVIEKDDMLRILAYGLKQNKQDLYVHLKEKRVTQQEKERLTFLLDQYYLESVPLQYILGFQPFYNEEYFVNKNVLIPREDTEILVQKAIAYISNYQLQSMLDLCCGSGCIGISILKNSNISSCTFVDISKEALEVTNQNLIHNHVTKKVLTIQSDLFEKVDEKFDLILSNPPYIKTEDIKQLAKTVQKEPLLALDGGEEGMDYYQKILSQIHLYLKEDGFFMFEIGYDELEKIKELIQTYEYFEILETVKDYANQDRVVICRFHLK